MYTRAYMKTYTHYMRTQNARIAHLCAPRSTPTLLYFVNRGRDGLNLHTHTHMCAYKIPERCTCMCLARSVSPQVYLCVVFSWDMRRDGIVYNQIAAQKTLPTTVLQLRNPGTWTGSEHFIFIACTRHEHFLKPCFLLVFVEVDWKCTQF